MGDLPHWSLRLLFPVIATAFPRHCDCFSPSLRLLFLVIATAFPRHCEEHSDVAIQDVQLHGLLRFARNDEETERNDEE